MRHFYNLRALSVSARPTLCKVLFSPGCIRFLRFVPCVRPPAVYSYHYTHFQGKVNTFVQKIKLFLM